METRQLRNLMDFLVITGTLFILIVDTDIMRFVMGFAWIFYIIILNKESKPKPILVKRWNKQKKKYLTFLVDERTGRYLKKVSDDNG
ncbi:hypothetical protein AYK24_08335 [Thermoplasmatales archaeon SG8-52-4]|nr:MAG: hypothetical protein AYK24_08335 [Thermoplasmatales archaeon SG8-52-4]